MFYYKEMSEQHSRPCLLPTQRVECLEQNFANVIKRNSYEKTFRFGGIYYLGNKDTIIDVKRSNETTLTVTVRKKRQLRPL